MAVAYLCLGSNKNDRVGNIQQAVRLLCANDAVKIIRSSTLYETEPWGKKDQKWFINAVMEVKVTIEPIELLRVCQSIEELLGRNRQKEEKWGPRTIDIDILFYDDKILKNDFLQIPHKYVHERSFMLVPMLEIAADFVHPVLNKTVSQLHEELDDPEDVYLYGTRINDD